ncbi:MAG: SPL family radical SAM protein [Candidatus Asgardarchaeia archaeon]
MRVLSLFDPWKNKLCTCPTKYSLNPYTGCDHRCRYCYITSYIPKAFEVRPKSNLIINLKKDLRKINPRIPISMSNSSDPYPTIEKQVLLTRKVLETLMEYNTKLLITTKSDIVLRDIDILKKLSAAVMITITTMNNEIAKKLEPFAPSPTMRIKAIEKLSKEGIPVGIRLDPIIIGINDSEENILDVIRLASAAGAKHIVASTYKPRADNWIRMKTAFPDIMEKTKHLYSDTIGHTKYLTKQLRRKLMVQVRQIAEEYKLTFATCREGFIDLHTAKSCDGTHLIPNRNKNNKNLVHYF